jgi:hypothetical protein
MIHIRRFAWVDREIYQVTHHFDTTTFSSYRIACRLWNMIFDAMDYDTFSSSKFLRLVSQANLDDPHITLSGYRSVHGSLIPHTVKLTLVDGLLLIQQTKVAM